MTNKLTNKKGFIPLDKKNRTGFTIIEVVLVLAIAGLIFLIVFLALPGLQRSRRDTQRKSDVGRMVAAVTNAASNSGTGNVPAFVASKPFAAASGTAGTDAVIITTDTYKDPSNPTTNGGAYTTTSAVNVAPSATGQIQYAKGYICDGSTATTTGANANNVAIVVGLESGGTYCQSQ